MDEYILFEGGPLHGQKRIVPKGLGFYSVSKLPKLKIDYGNLPCRIDSTVITYVRKNGKMVLEDNASTNG